MSNLRNFGIAWNQQYLETMSGPHLNEMDAVFPWLSAMVPEYVDASLLRCPADESRGRYGSKPDESITYTSLTHDLEGFKETDDNRNNPKDSGMYDQRNPDVEFNSYMYEFNDATITSWDWSNYILGSSNAYATDAQIDINGDGRVTWGEAKITQLAYGDTFSHRGYDRTQFPLVRCFNHYKDKEIKIQNLKNSTTEISVRVLNLAVGGNAFLSGLQWEYPLAP